MGEYQKAKADGQRYFRVVGLEQRQHYKKRNPPWIKLHVERLDDPAFAALPDNTKAHLLLIELLASRMGNRVLLDERYVRGRINARSRVNLPLLLDQGFIEICASKPLADCKRVATPEGEAEAETEGETEAERTHTPQAAELGVIMTTSSRSRPRIFDVVRETLQLRVQKNGEWRIVVCPRCTEDGSTIGINEEGAALIKCHCHCTTEQFLEEIGCTMADLYPSRSHGVARGDGVRLPQRQAG
jgi:hypothetical protein